MSKKPSTNSGSINLAIFWQMTQTKNQKRNGFVFKVGWKNFSSTRAVTKIFSAFFGKFVNSYAQTTINKYHMTYANCVEDPTVCVFLAQTSIQSLTQYISLVASQDLVKTVGFGFLIVGVLDSVIKIYKFNHYFKE